MNAIHPTRLAFVGLILALLWSLPARSDPVRLDVMEIPPYGFFQKNGAPGGLLYEISQAILQETGLSGEIAVLPILRILMRLQTGRTHCAIFIRHGQTEADNLPVAPTGLEMDSVVIARPGVALKSYDDLKRLTLARSRGTVFGHQVDRDHTLNIVPTDEYRQSTRMLLAGRVDAMLGVGVSLRYNLIREGADPDRFQLLKLNRNQMWLFCSRAHPIADNVLKRLRQAVKKLAAEGTLEKIMAPYRSGAMVATPIATSPSPASP